MTSLHNQQKDLLYRNDVLKSMFVYALHMEMMISFSSRTRHLLTEAKRLLTGLNIHTATSTINFDDHNKLFQSG